MAEIQTSASEDQVDTKASYMARLNYTLMDRYMLSFTIRRDGYSAFGQQNPWADFPAVASAWRISEEDFMKSVNWISNLKLRFSYGKNGNSNIGRYTALAGLANDFYLTEDKQNVVTLYPTSMGNRQLMWEETLAMNFGLDWGLFKNRLNVTAEVYKMKTTNMLMDRGLPTLTGYSKVKANLGQVNNKGLEITINSVNLNTKNLRWTSDLTFSLNRNEIKHLYGDLVPVTDNDGNIVNWKEPTTRPTAGISAMPSTRSTATRSPASGERRSGPRPWPSDSRPAITRPISKRATRATRRTTISGRVTPNPATASP